MEKDKKNMTSPSLEPNDPGQVIPKQDWPVGPLEDIQLDEAEQAENPRESAEPDKDKKQDYGTGQWPSVSWP